MCFLFLNKSVHRRPLLSVSVPWCLCFPASSDVSIRRGTDLRNTRRLPNDDRFRDRENGLPDSGCIYSLEALFLLKTD